MILFSALVGVVLMQGVPVAGASVERRVEWAWTGKTHVDRVVTDHEGRFRFEALTGRSFTARILPHEPVIKQTVTVTHDGAEHRIWMHNRSRYDAVSETGVSPQVFSFELTATHRHVDDVYGLFDKSTAGAR